MGRFITLLATLTGLLATLSPAPGRSAQPVVNAWQICDIQTARQERRTGIPRDLLKAISLAETGRWDDTEQATFAWPWTVMAQGQGQFFPTRQAALDYIHDLQGRGITNIDVGCMQINLFYHGDAFASAEHALDPEANTAYAASFLKDLYQSTRSWTQAAAAYHSNKPERARAYKLKVLKHWNTARQATASNERSTDVSVASASIDHVRVRELNRLRKIKQKSLAATDPGQLRRGQMAAWKKGGSNTFDIGQLAALRRIKLESQRRKEFQGTVRDETGDEFATKRRHQLDKWRLVGYVGGAG